MVRKSQKMSVDTKPTPLLSGAVRESAQQIWLAGLGAFSRAQEEGGKVFEALAKEGLSIQRKAQVAAEEKINEATSKMTGMATDIQAKAGHQWDKLETIFEDRVAKALKNLDVPSAKDVDALLARIDALSRDIQKLKPQLPAAEAAAKAVKKSPAKPPVARKKI